MQQPANLADAAGYNKKEDNSSLCFLDDLRCLIWSLIVDAF